MCGTQFIYSQIDPAYRFSEEKGGVEDEIPHLCKALGYPMTVSKSAIFACGSSHNWPKLLGVLDWMLDMIESAQGVDLDACIFGAQEEDFVEDEAFSNENQMFFDYLCQA